MKLAMSINDIRNLLLCVFLLSLLALEGTWASVIVVTQQGTVISLSDVIYLNSNGDTLEQCKSGDL